MTKPSQQRRPDVVLPRHSATAQHSATALRHGTLAIAAQSQRHLRQFFVPCCRVPAEIRSRHDNQLPDSKSRRAREDDVPAPLRHIVLPGARIRTVAGAKTTKLQHCTIVVSAKSSTAEVSFEQFHFYSYPIKHLILQLPYHHAKT